MRIRCFAAVCAAALFMACNQAASANLLIKVDKSNQQMTVSTDGKLLYTWPVSTGRRGYNTPSGDFTPLSMDRHHRSREWHNAPMPYSIFFTDEGHAIHGTNEVRHLGHAASHGCVRLSVAHAAVLWGLVTKEGKANTKVELTGKIPTRRAVARAKRKHNLARLRRHRLREARHQRKLRELRAARRARHLRALRAARAARLWRARHAAARYRRYAHERAYLPPRYADRYSAPPPQRYADRAPPPYADRNSARPPYPFVAFDPSSNR